MVKKKLPFKPVGRTLYSICLGLLACIPFALMLLPLEVSAQQLNEGQSEALYLSLDEAIEMARESNLQNKIAEQDVNIARAQYRQTNSVFLPRVTLEETAISTNNPLSVFGSLLRQEVVTSADFNPDLLNDPDHAENYTTSINVQQPLFNPSGIWARQASKKQLEAVRLQNNRTREYTDFQVKKTWYQLMLAQRQTGIIDTALTAAEANRDQAQNLLEQGMMTKADVIATEVRVKQLQSNRSQAKNQVEQIRRQLGYLLGINQDVEIITRGTMEIKSVPALQPEIGKLLQTRSDMQALDYQIDASRKKLTSMKFNFIPSVNLFGSYEWNDDSFLGTDAENYMIGATLKWELFNGFSNAGKIQQSRAQLSKAELQYQDRLQQNRIEIQSKLHSLQTAREQVEIAQQTVVQAKESYRIRHNRYKQGMERINDLLTAEATLAQSKLELVSTLYQYNVTVANLEFLMEHELSQSSTP